MSRFTRIPVTILLLCLISSWSISRARAEEAAADAESPAKEAAADAPAVSEETPEATAAEPVASEPPKVLPAAVHCGTLRTCECSDAAVPWVDLDKALLAGKLSPEDGELPDEAIVLKTPAPGHVFAIVTADVKAGRTLSRYDYSITAEGKSCPCLALAWGDYPYDVRRTEFSKAPGQVSLLFEIPAETPAISIDFALDIGIPQRSVSGIMLAEAPAVPEETAVVTDAGKSNDETARPGEAAPEAPGKDSESAAAPAEPAGHGKEPEKPATAAAPPAAEKAAPKPAAEQPKKPAADNAGDWF